MNITLRQRRISPESIAYKIAAMRNYYTPDFAAQAEQHPRLLEALWALQWFFMQPGGGVKFVQDFVETFSSRIGTAAMRRVGQKVLSDAEREAILKDIPRYEHGRATPASRAAAEFFSSIEDVSLSDCFETCRNAAAFKQLDYAGFHALCVKAALDDLPWRLAWFCGLPDKLETLADRHWRAREDRNIEGEDRCLKDVWYFENLPGALIEMLDVHKLREARKLAKTETADKVSDALQFALEEQCAVIIEGDTRFGKTKSATTWADGRPGLARVVRTPCSNVQFDLLRAVAEAIGIEVPLGMSRRELQHKVEFVLRHGGLFLIFDESHYLFPRLVSRNTTPARLDWVREQIMDRHCPLALVSTPQEFAHSLKRFTTTTNHNISQFLGRIAKTITIDYKRGDEDLMNADLMNVARLHFHDLPESYLELIAGKAMQTEKFLMTVESIAKLARFIARREKHATPTLDDLNLAISEVIPAAPAPAKPAPLRATARQHPIAAKRSRPALAAASDAPEPESAARSITPLLQGPARQTSPIPSPAPALESPSRATTPVLQPI
jgi:hypothetical protein